MANDVQYLIDMLYEMIDTAKAMPMARDKCVIVREDALDLLDDLRGQLPAELKKAQALTVQQLLRQAGDRANGMIGVANEYTDDALRRTEEAIQMALEEIRESRARFRAVSNEKLQAQRAKLEEQRGDGGRRQ